jgi:hypothetical protein
MSAHDAEKTTAGAESPAEQDIQADIVRTRAELGETVAQLVAKTDVKARARHAAAGMFDQVRGRAAQLKRQAAERSQLAGSKLSRAADGTARQASSAGQGAAGMAAKYRTQLLAAGALLVVALVVAARKIRR